MAIKVYHNNKKAFECEKLGRNGTKAAVKIGKYIAQTCEKSKPTTIHTFKIKGTSTHQILCAYYDSENKKWETKEVYVKNS